MSIEDKAKTFLTERLAEAENFSRLLDWILCDETRLLAVFDSVLMGCGERETNDRSQPADENSFQTLRECGECIL